MAEGWWTYQGGCPCYSTCCILVTAHFSTITSACLQVMAEGWWAAGNVPTVEDRVVRALLLGYTIQTCLELCTELAPGEEVVT